MSVIGVQNVLGLPDLTADLLYLSVVGLCSPPGFSCCSRVDTLLLRFLLRTCSYCDDLAAASGVSPLTCVWGSVRNTLSLSSVTDSDLNFGFAILVAPCVFMGGFGDIKSLSFCHLSLVGLFRGSVRVVLSPLFPVRIVGHQSLLC